jgi:hypothetical protein
MFERLGLTDIVMGLAVFAALGYMVFEINRRQAKLKELFDVLDHRDMEFTNSLEDLVRGGGSASVWRSGITRAAVGLPARSDPLCRRSRTGHAALPQGGAQSDWSYSDDGEDAAPRSTGVLVRRLEAITRK